jgi:hypothetical protein
MPLEHDPARTLSVEIDKVGIPTPIPTHIIKTKRVALQIPFHPSPRLAMQIPCALTDNALLVPFITQGR